VRAITCTRSLTFVKTDIIAAISDGLESAVRTLCASVILCNPSACKLSVSLENPGYEPSEPKEIVELTSSSSSLILALDSIPTDVSAIFIPK